MASVVEIVNIALIELGAATITNLTDGSKNANIMNTLYETLRDAQLRSHNWNFATERVKLARLATAPAFGFTYRYQSPSDFLRLRNVWDNENDAGTMQYSLEDDKELHANSEEVYLRYIKKVEDPNAMPVDFRMALSMALAEAACIALTNSRQLRAELGDVVARKLYIAKSADALEDFPESFPDGTWVNERGR